MAMRFLLILMLSLSLGGTGSHAQAPGTVKRADVEGVYRRPDLRAPLFEALLVPLTPDEVTAVLRDLQLIARNFPDSPWVDHRLRSHALSVALRLNPDDRASLVAGGQLARGIAPRPLSVDVPATPQGVAARLFEAGSGLMGAAEGDARLFARLLLDLAGRLDSNLLPSILPLTYGVAPDWPPAPEETVNWDVSPGLSLNRAEARVLLPGLEGGLLRLLTVKAEARPVEDNKGLRIALPEGLRRAMKEKDREALQAEVEQRLQGLNKVLRLRHDIWPQGWVIEITASDPDTLALPQLFAGMAVTVEALLSGEAPDSFAILAAGADAGGVLHTVIPLEQLVTAAALQQTSRMLILPAETGDALEDWLFLRPDQWPLLFHLTMHQAQDVSDAMALSKEVRAARLAQSLSRFDEIAARLRASGNPIDELRRPETLAQLREVTAWHPHHLSAAALLSVAAGGPATLTLRGSLLQIDRIARCVLSTDRREHPLHTRPERWKKTEFGIAMDGMHAVSKKLHPAAREYAAAVELLARMLDRTAGRWNAYLKKGPPEPPEIVRQRSAAASLRSLLEAKLK